MSESRIPSEIKGNFAMVAKVREMLDSSACTSGRTIYEANISLILFFQDLKNILLSLENVKLIGILLSENQGIGVGKSFYQSNCLMEVILTFF